MKIVIIGGTGLIGSKLADKLRTLGHEVNAASPASGVNTVTGEGLADALQGTDIVVDVANSPSFEDKAVLEFFETSGRNLLAAEAAAGVKHHIALSVVGTDRLQESGYFRAKQAQENLIKNSSIPYTIVHSTQFFEFLGSIVASAAKDAEIHLSPAEIQPISSDDVATAMAQVTLSKPLYGTVEIAGPELYSLAELAIRYLQKTGDARTVKVDTQARYFGAILQNKTLVPAEDARLGNITFEAWFANRQPRPVTA
jgi:uncharacterized protein YbjT (DUF2867 family)